MLPHFMSFVVFIKIIVYNVTICGVTVNASFKTRSKNFIPIRPPICIQSI